MVGDYLQISVSDTGSGMSEEVISKIFDSLEQIKEYPSSGRIVPELNDENIREIFIYSYRVLYKISTNSVLILAVIHGKQLLNNIENRY